MRQAVTRLLASQLQIPELPAPITFSAGVIRIRDYLTVAEATDPPMRCSTTSSSMASTTSPITRGRRSG